MRSTERSSGARWLACIAVLALTIVGAGAQTSDQAPSDHAASDPAAADQATDVSADQPAQAPADEAAAIPFDQLDFSVLNEPMLEAPLRAWPTTRGDAGAPAVGSRRENLDGSVSVTAGQRLPTEWESKVGVDVAAPATLPDPLAGLTAPDRGAGWANLAVPADEIGLDKATIDARVDPSADQGKLSTSLSRSVAVGDGLSVTFRNGYAVTQTLAAPNGMTTVGAPTRVYTGDGGVRVDLPTATALSAGATVSSADDRLLPSVSAEQKLFGTPLSVTGTIRERPTGDTDRSIKAGLKHTW